MWTLAFFALLLTAHATRAVAQTDSSTTGTSAVVRTWRGYNPLRLTQPNVPVEDRSLLSHFADSSRHFVLEIGADGKVVGAAAFDSVPDPSSQWMRVCGAFQFDLLGAEGNGRRLTVVRVSADQFFRNYRVQAAQTLGRPLDYRLLELTLHNAGKAWSRVQFFPSFYPIRQSADSQLLPPVVLLKIERNESGRVTTSDIMSSTVPSIAPLIEAAGLRARFTDQGGTSGTADSLYLLIHLLSTGVSPIPVIKDTIATEWFGFPRVVVLPDRPESAELLCPPLPKSDFQTLHWAEFAGNQITVPTKAVIGKDGRTRIYVDMSMKREIRAKMDKRLHEIRFFPAVLANGEPIEWRGNIRFDFSTDGKLRVHTDWL